jgi:hypothetical protein
MNNLTLPHLTQNQIHNYSPQIIVHKGYYSLTQEPNRICINTNKKKHPKTSPAESPQPSSRRRSRPNNLPLRAKPNTHGPLILRITAHIAILMHIPALAWPNALGRVARCRARFALRRLPFALAFAFALFLALQHRLGRPAARLGFGLAGCAARVFVAPLGGGREAELGGIV